MAADDDQQPTRAELIAEVERLHAELAEARARGNTAWETLSRAPIGIEIYDADGVAEWLNQPMVDFLGIPDPSAAIGKFNVLTDPFAVESGLAEHFAPVYRGETVEVPAFPVDLAAGTSNWKSAARIAYFDELLFPILDEAGAVQRVVAVVREVTEQKRLENELRTINSELEARVAERTAALEHAYSELESFSYTVSHDLRAPARAVEGFAEMLREEMTGDLAPEALRHLDQVATAANRMSHMIAGLLTMSLSTRGNLHLEPVDVSALARIVLEEQRSADPDRELVATVADGLTARGDARLLRLLLDNLIGNAWKFTAGRMDALIEVAPHDDEPGTWFVRDNGVGFDATRAAELFQPFRRLHGDDFEGTGVGLATARRIVERHHGRIWASAEPGKGATFFVALPDAA